ncbi:CAP domain-containing protein [Streptomyces caatingaensis]|uniref:CAP domain-containing protein n=1 Tax=Streptomyces caatingaensis TaxID=1678637 RepID=UPI00067270F4|nr:CAP domain-containing protein [Streptomyces caatingaensis]
MRHSVPAVALLLALAGPAAAAPAPPPPWQYAPSAPPAWSPSAVPQWPSPGPGNGAPARPGPGSRPRERGGFRGALIELLNRERHNAGCPAVHGRRALDRAAQDHSAFMAHAQRLSHTGRAGSDPGRRITRAGYRFGRAGEEIVAGPRTPGGVVRAWMGSPPHRRSLLTCAFRDAGVGRSEGARGPWWTLLLAVPR